jgi:2-methylisocitrate lyase-like PEP mutase family enzyme
MTQSQKAEAFKKLHEDSKLLLLPNIWDSLSAKLIASQGFPALATASVSLSAVNGFQDGENIPFKFFVQRVSAITKSVDLPVTVDFECGYADNLPGLRENVKCLLDAGIVGINIEDSQANNVNLTPVFDQCKRIETIRDEAQKFGVDLFLNARTDIYLKTQGAILLADVLDRGLAYQAAGADCFYPILIHSYDDVLSVVENLTIPVNILLIKPLSNLRKLEQLGVKRVSLGPGTLKYALTKIRNMVVDLKNYNSESFFIEDMIDNNFLKELIN